MAKRRRIHRRAAAADEGTPEGAPTRESTPPTRCRPARKASLCTLAPMRCRPARKASLGTPTREYTPRTPAREGSCTTPRASMLAGGGSPCMLARANRVRISKTTKRANPIGHPIPTKPLPIQSKFPTPNPDPDPAMPDDPAATSSGGDDDEGTDTDASNSDLAAPLPDATSAPPPPPAPEPTGAVPPPPQPQGAAAATEDSRRLFQRLWTDEEELLILRGFLNFTARRGTTFASHKYDTGPFYEELRQRLSFDFTKNQLIEKLRRLKKKYRVCAARMAAQGAAFAFRSAHEGAIYDVARHIWWPAFRRDVAGGGDASDEDDINPAAAVVAATPGVLSGAVEDVGGGSASAPTPRGRGGRRVRRKTVQELEAPALPATSALMLNDVVHEPLVVAIENLAPAIAPPPPVVASLPAPVTACGDTEEAVRTILSPLLRDLISSVAVAGQTRLGFGGIGLGFWVDGLNPGVPDDEKWRHQQILELEVYLKRIELVREQVANALEELRSSEG